MNKSSLSLLIWMGLVTSSLALCDQAGQYCVYGTTNEAGQNVLTIHSAAKGWTSIGIGSSMTSCTEIYLIWKNSKGEIVLSPRNSSSQSMPIYNHASRSYLTNHRYQVPAWANLAASIVVPYRLSNLTRFIYASSGSPVQSPDLKNSNFFMHDSKGQFTGLDFPLPIVRSVQAQSKFLDGLFGGGNGGNGAMGGTEAIGGTEANGSEQQPKKFKFWEFLEKLWRVEPPQESQKFNAGMGGGSQNWGSQNPGMAPPMGANAWGQNPASSWGQQGSNGNQYPASSWNQQSSNWNQYPASSWNQQGYNWNQYPASSWSQQGSYWNQYPTSSWGQQGYNWNQYPTSSWGQQGQGSSAWNYNGWGQRGFCREGRFCVEADIVKDDVHFTLHSSSPGWVALGVGSSMLNSDIFCFWMGSTGIVLSRRVPHGFRMPVYNSNTEGIHILPLNGKSPSWAQISVSFSVPKVNINPSSGFIYAQGNFVEDPDSPSSVIGIHNTKGKITDLFPAAEMGLSLKYYELDIDDAWQLKFLGEGSNGIDNFCDSTRFCVYGRRENEKVVYTIHSASDGWTGFGLGANMMDADIFVFWKKGDGSNILSRRKAVGHMLPIVNSGKEGISMVELDVPAPNWAKMAVSFTKPVNYESRPNPKYIYALGSSVSDRSSELSAFNYHDTKGVIIGKDFLSNSREPPKAGDESTLAGHSSPSNGGESTPADHSLPSNSGESTSADHSLPSNDAAWTSANHSMFCDFYAKRPGTTNMFCLYGRPVDDRVLFTIHSSASGWAGVGLGSTMRNADMYIFWKNSSGDGYTVSRRISDGVLMPKYNDDLGQISVSPLDVPSPEWAQLSVSFSLPISDNLSGKTDFIFGHSNFSVENPDSPQSTFSKHNKKGKISGIDFLSKNTTLSNVVPDENVNGDKTHLIIQIHGILMLFAWSISPFIGIFVARYMKKALGVWWYRIHVFLMLFVTGVFTLSAFALIYSFSQVPLLSSGIHGKMGLIIIMTMILQIILGFICNALWSKDRVSIPWYDKAHWWIGRIVTILGIINVSFGIKLYTQMFNEPEAVLYAYWICMVIGVALLIFGQFKFGQINHHNSLEHLDAIFESDHRI